MEMVLAGRLGDQRHRPGSQGKGSVVELLKANGFNDPQIGR